jgi:hypothetical protein
MPRRSLSHTHNLLWMLSTGQWQVALWRLDMHRRGVEMSMAGSMKRGLTHLARVIIQTPAARGSRASSRAWIFRVPHVLEPLERRPRELTTISWIPVGDALLAQMGFRKGREFRDRLLPVAVYKPPAVTANLCRRRISGFQRNVRAAEKGGPG